MIIGVDFKIVSLQVYCPESLSCNTRSAETGCLIGSVIHPNVSESQCHLRILGSSNKQTRYRIMCVEPIIKNIALIDTFYKVKIPVPFLYLIEPF